MLVKLTAGVNFINVLQPAFIGEDPELQKKTVKLSVFFVHLGSSLSKASRKMLVKLTPDVF